ncbi:MAG: hypothetical protein GF401_13715 [Chitinivibrionales bacterium]|nr:hypothetical protein [Chitinivibrionales bacterium]
MKKYSFLLLGLFLFLVSCGSQYPMLAQDISVQCKELHEICSQKKIKSAEATTADSLYTTGLTLYQKGKNKDAYPVLESAAMYYRLALSKDELEDVNNEIDRLKESLTDAEDKLGMYKKVLSELETMERP